MNLSSGSRVACFDPDGNSLGSEMATIPELAAAVAAELPPGVGELTLADVYPVGTIYTSVVATNPATVFGFGTWAAIAAGRVLVGFDANDSDFNAAKKTSGSKTHTLTTAEIPSHTHVQTNNSATTGGLVGYAARDTSTNTQTATGYSTEATGGGGAHNNLQPSIVVHFFERTA